MAERPALTKIHKREKALRTAAGNQSVEVMLINFGHDKRQYADTEKDAEGASFVAFVLI